jgi:hypothetical protein
MVALMWGLLITWIAFSVIFLARILTLTLVSRREPRTSELVKQSTIATLKFIVISVPWLSLVILLAGVEPINLVCLVALVPPIAWWFFNELSMYRRLRQLEEGEITESGIEV